MNAVYVKTLWFKYNNIIIIIHNLSAFIKRSLTAQLWHFKNMLEKVQSTFSLLLP